MSARRDLSRLLRPRSIAVVGGGFFGTNVVRQCVKMDFAGDIWPVHPTRDAVEGLPAFRSIAELPEAPDAVFVGVNRHLTVDIVRDLRLRGAGGAVCFASGFLEAGQDDADGARLQQALLEAAGDMPVIGPNCYGLINYCDGALLWPDQHGGVRLAEGERGAAIVTQSSNIAINLTMQRRGLPLAYVMTAGNQAQTGLSEIALGLIEDERVSVLGLHIEGFDSVAGFERLAARARELRKPVVAMKVGRSEQARAGTVSHTASLAGSDAASNAFLRRLGIARVDAIPSFLETLKLLHAVGPLGGSRLSSMSCSGGEAALMADSADGRRVHFPRLMDEHRARVKATLGPLVAVANPLDYHTFIWNDEPAMMATFSAMVSGGFDLNLLVLDFPRHDRCSDADWRPTVDAFAAALEANGARGAVVASMPENLPEDYCAQLLARGIAPLCGITEALDAAEAAVKLAEAWNAAAASPLRGGWSAEGRPGGDPSPGTPSFQYASSPSPATPPGPSGLPPVKGEGTHPDEAAAKALLAAHGLPVPDGKVAVTAEEATFAATEIGFPVALKALGIAHKSEAGAVRLGLADGAAVYAAAGELLQLSNRIYVEAMIEGAVAELIVGVTRDPAFGPVMTVGSGGVLVELLQDTATLLLPATRDEVDRALRSLKLFPLLDGFRGRPRADLSAAIVAILGIGDFAIAHADSLDELDINPLIVCERGAWVADALIVFGPLASLREGETDLPVGAIVPGGKRATAERMPPTLTPTGVAGRPSPHGRG
ncbi:acetate--CoA ligase family protein [Nitratireductor mangrovi]|uniref:Acetate--CoA ligase family protein n=1 Tax=Nitratireductor mangrovi TaxID=2599600 RepID=A0A5B8L067_9HYPH|nr:acetate--CoA ligase family protein [Nitratireductor mangrovi]QDZ01424.1 acetate--CoA ligase family protein [Nitratireductor mangrovi]